MCSGLEMSEVAEMHIAARIKGGGGGWKANNRLFGRMMCWHLHVHAHVSLSPKRHSKPL